MYCICIYDKVTFWNQPLEIKQYIQHTQRNGRQKLKSKEENKGGGEKIKCILNNWTRIHLRRHPQKLYVHNIRDYFMLFGSLSENNGGLPLDNFTVSSSEIIIHRANRLFSEDRSFAIRRSYWLTIKRKMQSWGHPEAMTLNMWC